MHGKAGSEGARKGGHGYSVAKTGHDGLRGRPVFWATQQDLASFEFRAEDEKAKRKQVKKQRKQAELRLKEKWRTLVKAAGQGAHPMERMGVMVQARERRAEQGQPDRSAWLSVCCYRQLPPFASGHNMRLAFPLIPNSL